MRTSPRKLLSENRLRPKPWLGQNFLADSGAADKIVRLSDIGPEDTVLEIGPGLGALTLPMAKIAEKIYAVEKDRDIIPLLASELKAERIQNVDIIPGNILDLRLAQLLCAENRKSIVVGNLPYNISSPLLEKLVDRREKIKTALVMLQHEFARRLTASPGSKAYGALTVLTQYYAKLTPLLRVGREAFYPQPGVDSMVIEIDFQRPYPRRAEDEILFKKTVRQSFLHKRKTLLNSLCGATLPLTKEDLKSTLLKAGLDPNRRAETLSMDEFLRLAAVLATCA